MSAMLKTSRALRAISQKTQTARFSVVARKMAEGSTGSPRSGGAASGDAFNKREEASENLYIRQQEKRKLEELKAKIKRNQEQMDKDQKDLSELEGKK